MDKTFWLRRPRAGTLLFTCSIFICSAATAAAACARRSGPVQLILRLQGTPSLVLVRGSVRGRCYRTTGCSWPCVLNDSRLNRRLPLPWRLQVLRQKIEGIFYGAFEFRQKFFTDCQQFLQRISRSAAMAVGRYCRTRAD